MGNNRLKLLAACAAIALSGSAQASTTVAFSTQLDNTFPTPNPVDARHITLTGSATFAADIVDGTYTVADLTDFTTTLNLNLHLRVAPPGVFFGGTYNYGLADLTDLSITFLGGQAVAGFWDVALKAPSSGSPGFNQVFGYGVNSNDDDTVSFYSLNADHQPTKVGGTNFGDVTTTVTSAAPEPGSWMLMVGGFGMAGAAMRSRRKTAVSFA